MRTRIFTALVATTLLSLAVVPASAKTAKACTKEWQADKAAMQAAGKTEKAYVAECRGTPTAARASKASAPTYPKEDKGGNY
ncbi:MAG TPA: hypothetical protein VGI22_00990 [Xanthobacteraceae bacterium]|jgi:hypothetical protein